MYVQEYGSECPHPNTRHVYIAYLDSVKLIHPMKIRTMTYREIVLSYLDYVKHLGYSFANIWSCPPNDNEAYIFYNHPESQKIPTPERLQQWYIDLFTDGKKKGIIVDFQNIQQSIQDEKLKIPDDLPYFEGDMWPDILEENMKDLEEKMFSAVAVPNATTSKRYKRHNFKRNIIDKRRNPYKAKRIEKNFQLNLRTRIRRVIKVHEKSFFVIKLHSVECAATLPDIVDPDPYVACDFIEDPDNFLNFARENNYEFSSYQKAVCSTAAILHAVHIEQKYSYSYSCNQCGILIEIRYHCHICDDFDLCINCYLKSDHYHKMVKYEANGKPAIVAKYETYGRGKQFLKSIIHGMHCSKANCDQPECRDMKEAIHHFQGCSKKMQNSCDFCKEIKNLFLKVNYIHEK